MRRFADFLTGPSSNRRQSGNRHRIKTAIKQGEPSNWNTRIGLYATEANCPRLPLTQKVESPRQRHVFAFYEYPLNIQETLVLGCPIAARPRAKTGFVIRRAVRSLPQTRFASPASDNPIPATPVARASIAHPRREWSGASRPTDFQRVGQSFQLLRQLHRCDLPCHPGTWPWAVDPLRRSKRVHGRSVE